MTILAPLAALFALSLPLIVILHLRRSRPRPLPVTTLPFWQEAAQHRRQRLSWRRPPRALLLLAQLLIAGLLSLALARPALPLPGLPGNQPARQLIVVLDRSTAMRATDVAPTRFDAAKARARELIGGAAHDEQVTLLTLDAEPQVYRSRDAGDRAALFGALDRLVAGGGRADLNAALPALRATLLPERENRIVLISAGVFAAAPDRVALAALPGALTWEQIGAAVSNVAITRLTARPRPRQPDQYDLFATVANFAAAPVSTRGRVVADGAVVDERALAVPAGGAVDLVWQLPRGAREAQLRIDGNDALAIDNEARVVLRGAQQVRVLLVTHEAGDLGRALAAQPGVVLTTVPPGAYGERARYDLTVFDGFVPPSLPVGGVFLVNPPLDNAVIPAMNQWETPKVARFDRESSLLAGVDLSGLTFTSQRVFTAPPWGEVVAASEAGPLIVASNNLVVFTFDLARSNLPRKLAFPLLIGNVVEQVQTHRVPTSAQLGAGVALEPVASTTRAQLRDPAGQLRDLSLRAGPGEAPLAYVVLDDPGLYTLIQRDRDGNVLLQEPFAVNSGDRVASNLLAVLPDLPAGQGGIAPPQGEQAATRVAPRRLGELWPALLALALVFLLGEWVLGLLGPGAPRAASARVAPRPGLAALPRHTRLR